jgi:hypothetical protein
MEKDDNDVAEIHVYVFFMSLLRIPKNFETGYGYAGFTGLQLLKCAFLATFITLACYCKVLHFV